MYDVNKIREDFPILGRLVYDRPLVYLDNGATTQKPSCVVETIAHEYFSCNANVHRGVHYLSQKATELHEASREVVRLFINAKSTNEIIFTSGTTGSINLVATTFGQEFLEEGDEIIVSTMEHHSNIVPWQLLEMSKGVKVKVIPITEQGELDFEAFENLISNRTKLVSVAHISNVLGTVNPIKRIIDRAHQEDIPVLIDGAQAAPHTPIDVQELNADFYVFSAHKVYGPTGVGVLYGKEEWLDKLPPYQGGGEMIQHVSFSGTTFNELPFKFEAGTPNFVGTTGMAKALEYVQSLGLENIAQHEDELLSYATKRLNEIDGLRIYGEAKDKSGVISFLVNDIHPFDLGTLLDRLGIAVRTGHHCAQPLMEYYGIEGTVRASFALYNTKEEVDSLVDGLNKVLKMF
ncbi:MAG: cysteine desulfurase [Bacteroides sp.]|nr:cysteine desulfurase [Bacteroides sp.]MDD2645591.1 cysteine desulfurase [Bacteroides sp.]MDD4720182.1 cysteine desulfurase [Bacteroides sp.]NLI64686.1 cysteine desulfurase [Bacteroidales bacterium]